VDRSEVFLETKIWISDYGYDETLHGFEKSARKLGVDQIDLLILHQALPSAFERTLEAYRALETLLADGKVRAIGVSNFMVDHLATLLDRASVVPAVNPLSRKSRGAAALRRARLGLSGAAYELLGISQTRKPNFWPWGVRESAPLGPTAAMNALSSPRAAAWTAARVYAALFISSAITCLNTATS